MSIKMLETWLNAMVTDRYDSVCKVLRQAGKISRKAGGGSGGGSSSRAAAPPGTSAAAVHVPLASMAEKTAQFLAAFYHQVHPTALLRVPLGVHARGIPCNTPPVALNRGAV